MSEPEKAAEFHYKDCGPVGGGWPHPVSAHADEAAVDAVAEVLAQNRNPFPLYPPTVMGLDRDEARLMLATPVVTDAFRDAETLAKVREIMADWKAGKLDLSDVPSDIADLLAGEA